MKITTRSAIFVTSLCVALYLIFVAIFAYNDNPRSVGYVLFYQLPLVVFMLIPFFFFISRKNGSQQDNNAYVMKNIDRISLFLIYPLTSAIIVTMLVWLIIYSLLAYKSVGDALGLGIIVYVVCFLSFVIMYVVVCIVNIVRCCIDSCSVDSTLVSVNRWFLLIIFIGIMIYGLISF